LILLAGVSWPKAFELVHYRQTNMDLIADELRNDASTNDLILVYPWYCGISFERYFDGKTPWTTIPDLDDHRFHRYDLLKIKMQVENPIQPVLDKIAATLQSGNRVWIIGFMPFNTTPPKKMKPAPNESTGWLEQPYSHAWGESAGYFIRTHGARAKIIPIQSPNPINDFENLPLTTVAGWRAPSHSKPR
jgi:hypothetical protein